MTTNLSYRGCSLRARLENGTRLLVDRVSFDIAAGESLALIGETGSGKTMIAQSIMGVLPANVTRNGGEIALGGEPLPGGKRLRVLLGRDIVYIPQNGHEFLNPSRSIRRQLQDSLRHNGIPRREWEKTALDCLRRAGFDAPGELMELYPFQLSGGMAQRVTIALALCAQPVLLIADEPTNGLDAEGRQRFMDQLNELFPRASRLIITHDISVAALCDRVLVLCGGRMQETGPARAVLQQPKHPYTAALIGALVENGMRETPVLRDGKARCPFYARCAKAQPVCGEEETAEHADGERKWWCCI